VDLSSARCKIFLTCTVRKYDGELEAEAREKYAAGIVRISYRDKEYFVVTSLFVDNADANIFPGVLRDHHVQITQNAGRGRVRKMPRNLSSARR
jgi:hypothetical protein